MIILVSVLLVLKQVPCFFHTIIGRIAQSSISKIVEKRFHAPFMTSVNVSLHSRTITIAIDNIFPHMAYGVCNASPDTAHS